MPDEPQNLRTREALLLRAQDHHEALDTLLASLTDEELTQPGVTDAWSVKDHMAHLTWWEQRVIRMLGGAPDPVDGIPGVSASDPEDVRLARINDHVFSEQRDLPLAVVRAAFAASYGEMLHLIQTVPDDVLAAQYDWIEGNSSGHYEEHIQMVCIWREREVHDTGASSGH